MGIFDIFKSSKDEKKETEIKFSEFIIETEDVSRELQESANRYSISVTNLDFELLGYRTLIKKDKNSKEFEEINKEEFANYNKPEIILNRDFVVKQIYEIKIKKYKDEKWNRELFVHINLDKNRSIATCTIKKDSLFIYFDELFDSLKNLIHKQMVKSNILLELWEVDYDDVLQELCSKVHLKNRYRLEEDIEFDVAVCNPPIKPVDSKLILHFEDSYNFDANDRIDYRKRGYILPVEKGELIIEYIKAKPGVPGRSCKGEYLAVREAKEIEKLDFTISENIEKSEDNARIIYKSLKNGYIIFKDNRYDILDEMQVKRVSFKETGSIEAGTETEVKLHIHENDVIKEAVGEGLEVEAEKINIEGNIASSSKVVGIEVFIGGQTHKTSKVYAKQAKINVLRGYIRADEVEVKRLEGGVIDAKNVKIEQAIGGEVRAINITIDKIGANVKFYASSLIEIGDILGENNKFIIDATKIPSYKKELTNLENKKEKIKEKIIKVNERLEKLVDIKNRSESSIKALKKKIIQDNERGIKPQNSFIIKIKQFQQLVENIGKKQNEYEKLKNEIELIENELSTYQEMILNAKIVNRGTWKDFTEIEYRLLNPPQQIEYHPKAGEKNQEIYLKQVDDDFYEIATKKIEE